MRALRSGGFNSMAQFVREACLRLAYDEDITPRYSELEDIIDGLKDIKHKFINHILRVEHDLD